MSMKTADRLMHIRARLHFLNSNSSFPSGVAIRDQCCIQFADSALNFASGAPFFSQRIATGNILLLYLKVLLVSTVL
jgi:hypothetical protein